LAAGTSPDPALLDLSPGPRGGNPDAMAIFGSFSTVRTQLAADPRFRAALDYVGAILTAGSPERGRIEAMADDTSEKHELAAGATAIDQVYPSRERPDGFFEAHRKYIDVQAVVSGEEFMEVADLGRMKVSQEYNPERDFLKYADVPDASRLRVRAGEVAVFFPEDVHMPCLHTGGGPARVRKTVIKVPVA